MGMDLRLFVVEKEDVECKRSWRDPKIAFINPKFAFSLIRRSDLFQTIQQFSDEQGESLNCSLLIDFQRKQVLKDRTKRHLRVVSCEGIAKMLFDFSEPFRNYNGKHPNDAVAEFLLAIGEKYVCVLYWH